MFNELKSYPTINYIGNKEKIADWIISEMPIESGVVLDLFCGGCSVSYTLKKHGYNVIANDILYANYVIAKAIIENNSTVLTDKIFDKKVSDVRVQQLEKELFFLSNNLYFDYEIKELAYLVALSETLRGYEKYMFLALLRRAMIRKIPYSRMNVKWGEIQKLRDEEYSYSKYKRRRAYHNLSFKKHILDNLEEYNNSVFSSNECKVYNLDAFKMIKKINMVDVVYIDPPYPSTMNNYDAFYGAYDDVFSKRKTHVDFTNKNNFLDILNKIIVSLKGKTQYVVISLNSKVKPAPDDIIHVLGCHGKVLLKEKNHNYQVTGKENKAVGKELLLILSLKQDI